MRRKLSLLLALSVMMLSLFSVSAQAGTIRTSISADAARIARQELIEQMGNRNSGMIPRDPGVVLPAIPRDKIVQVPTPLCAIDPDEYYGRQVLASRENPDLVKAYDYFGQQVSELEQVINFDQFRVTPQEVLTIYFYYRNDHPEAFWLSNSCEWFSFGYSITTGMPSIILMYEYAVPKEDIVSMQQQLEARTAEFLDGITGDMTQEERERLVVERLNEAAVYDHSLQAPNNHNVLGVLLYGTGVCESYARAFQYLMYHCGIQCLYVSGDTLDGPHAWNLVNINGEWLMIDPTGCDNDNDSNIEEYYYNFTYAEFLKKSWYVNIKVGDPTHYPLPI